MNKSPLLKPAMIATAILISACASSEQNLESYFRGKNVPPPEAQQFSSCRGYGCKYVDPVTLTPAQWQSIDHIFRSMPATNAQAEREKIKTAISRFETYVGAQTGTDVDVGGTFIKTGTHQQDCVDESTNTSIYLSTLEKRNLLQFHTTENPTVRIPIIHAGRWPHQTAVIKDIKTSNLYAIDSWFHENGRKPEIIPLKQWKEGWKPDKGT